MIRSPDELRQGVVVAGMTVTYRLGDQIELSAPWLKKPFRTTATEYFNYLTSRGLASKMSKAR